MNKLMSCPFCGHEAEELSQYQVKCTYCDARILGVDGAATIARLNWNTRVDPNKHTITAENPDEKTVEWLKDKFENPTQKSDAP